MMLCCTLANERSCATNIYSDILKHNPKKYLLSSNEFVTNGVLEAAIVRKEWMAYSAIMES